VSAGPGHPCDANGAHGRAARGPVAPAAVAAVPTDTVEFVLFGWVSPPADSTDEARVAEMAEIGLNLMLPAWLDAGCEADNLARLDWAAAHGMRCLVWDSRLNGALAWLPTFEDTLDDVAAAYRDHPAFWGYYLGDEPPRALWPLLARLRESLRARDPVHPAWNNLSGRAVYPDCAAFATEVRDYAERFSPATLSADHYDFRTFGDYGQFVENLDVLNEVAGERGIPFWNILQLVPHANIRPLGHGELRWQVAHSLAYGARGVGYFTYWTPDPDPVWNWQPAIIGNDGVRTPWYEFLRSFNPGVRTAGARLARAIRRRTTHSGSRPAGGVAFTPGGSLASVEGRAAIGEFTGGDGEALVLVANSDSLAARVITLEARESPGGRLVAGGSSPALQVEPLPRGARLAVSLAAGDFALLELEPAVARSSLAIVPNPAANAVRFVVRTPAGGWQLEIVDPGGRRQFRATQAAATGEFEWRGQRASGGFVAPGVYLARLRGPDGSVVTRRFAWLGSR